MKNISLLSKTICFFVFAALIVSCKKEMENAVTITTDNNLFAAAPANTIKTIEVKDSGKLKDRYEFFYKRGLLDSISHKNAASGFQEYDRYEIFYAKGSILPSGYRYSKGLGLNFTVIASFLTNGRFINQKILTTDHFTDNSADTNHAFIYYYDNNKIISSQYGTYNALYDEIILRINYGAGSLTSASLLGDYSQAMFVSNYDENANPLSFQNRILYYLSINPFNILHGYITTGYNLFDLLMLCNNNPGRVLFDYGDQKYGLKLRFTYTYNASNLPQTINLHMAEGYFSAGYPNYNPQKEELAIIYY